MSRQLFAAALLLASSLAPVVRADDWPQFRGPTGQGLFNGELPTAWGPEKNVVWKQTVPGKGWSSPVVAGGRVYLTTAVPGDGADESLRALCLDAADGKILWDKEVFRQDGRKPARVHAKNSHASPTPVVRGERLFVHFGHQGTACLDLKGDVLWRNRDLTYSPVHGNGGSPILAGDKLVFSCDGGDQAFLVALGADDGKVRWKTERSVKARKSFSFGTPLLIKAGGREQIISPASDAVYAYAPEDGKEIWRVRYSGYSVVPRPAFGQGLVFVSSGFDAPVLLAIRPDGKGDVTDTHVAWRMRRGAPNTPSPLLVGAELYVVSDGGRASCLEARTGRLYWQESLGGSYSASPLAAGGKLYFQSEQGTGVVLRAGRQFKELARNALDERSLASPAAADGALFVRTERHLYRFGAR